MICEEYPSPLYKYLAILVDSRRKCIYLHIANFNIFCRHGYAISSTLTDVFPQESEKLEL